jgi:hypothetical protein
MNASFAADSLDIFMAILCPKLCQRARPLHGPPEIRCIMWSISPSCGAFLIFIPARMPIVLALYVSGYLKFAKQGSASVGKGSESGLWSQ